MQVVRAIYDGRDIRAVEPIKVKRQTEVLVIFPDEAEKPGTMKSGDRQKIDNHFLLIRYFPGLYLLHFQGNQPHRYQYLLKYLKIHL
jgi:hypothetical protein